MMGQGDCDQSIVSTTVNKICLSLQSEDKRDRKQALIEFKDFLTNGNFTEDDFHNIFRETHIYIFNTLRDKSEVVREASIKFFKYYLIDTLPRNDFYISYLFPILIERIGTVELVEESEEIRLQLVLLMQEVIKKYSEGNVLKPFLNDFITILKEIVKDKYPAIKENACKSIVILTFALPQDFHLQAENLVKPVLTAFGHQRNKIRIEAIKCMGELVLHCSYKAIEDVTGPLAERLFDPIPAVRRTVCQVTARWLLEYRDRYSFFHKLLPLILTGLNDEVQETRDEAYQLWIKVGLQYEKENERDLKDQLDYLNTMPKYYPHSLIRPNLGCRTLVKTTISKLTRALAHELTSWKPDVRVRCGQLLCAIAHHAEDNITQYLQDLLIGMYAAARDNDKRVVVNIMQASELMGLFVPVEAWKQILLPTIEDSPHFGHLMILAGFIRGSPQEYICSSLREISQILADPSICYSRKMQYQRQLIKCVEAIEAKYSKELSDDIGQFLFNIIITMISIKYIENVSIDYKLVENLRETLQIQTDYELWHKYIRGLLMGINKEPKAWTEVTIERSIFETILLRSGEAFGENLDLISEILVNALDTEVEAESRLKTFSALTSAFDEKDVIFKRAINLEQFLKTIVVDVLVPSLVWHAGRTAEAMRTMAASCLCSALHPSLNIELFEDKEVLRSIFNRLLPLLLSLVEDASYRSRHLAIEALILLKDNLVLKADWNADDLIKIYPEVLKRLDDPTDQVRICAIKATGYILKDPPEEFLRETFKAHYELLLDTILTHFDDDDSIFQTLIMDVLKIVATANKKITEEKILKHKPLLRNENGCEEILKCLEELKL